MRSIWMGTTSIFSSLHRCSIGVKSGHWLGHSRKSRDLYLTYKLSWLYTLGDWCCLQSGAGFLQGLLCTWLHSSFNPFWPVSLSLPLRNTPSHDATTTILSHRDGTTSSWAVHSICQEKHLDFSLKLYIFYPLIPENNFPHSLRVLYAFY